MDPRERADAALARARARGAFVVTPDDAVSPMDAANTVQIPRSVVNAAEQSDSTMVIPGGMARGQQQQQGTRPNMRPVPQPGPQHPHQGPPPGQPGPYGPPPGHQQGYPPRGQQSGPQRPVPYPNQQPQQPMRPQQQPVPQEQQQYEEPQPTPRQLDGLVPTTQQPGTQRSMMSRKLDGQ